MPLTLDNERFRKLLQVHPWQALQILYELYYDAMLRIATRLTRDTEAARDIVQDSFVDVFENRRRVATLHDKSIENYLARIVRNKSVSHYKRSRTVDIDFILLFKQFDYGEDPLSAMIGRELYQEFRAIISALPMRQRQAIEMRIDQDMTLDEIAAELKISRKMVENSQTKAMKKLRQWAAGKK